MSPVSKFAARFAPAFRHLAWRLSIDWRHRRWVLQAIVFAHAFLLVFAVLSVLSDLSQRNSAIAATAATLLANIFADYLFGKMNKIVDGRLPGFLSLKQNHDLARALGLALHRVLVYRADKSDSGDRRTLITEIAAFVESGFVEFLETSQSRPAVEAILDTESLLALSFSRIRTEHRAEGWRQLLEAIVDEMPKSKWFLEHTAALDSALDECAEELSQEMQFIFREVLKHSFRNNKESWAAYQIAVTRSLFDRIERLPETFPPNSDQADLLALLEKANASVIDDMPESGRVRVGDSAQELSQQIDRKLEGLKQIIAGEHDKTRRDLVQVGAKNRREIQTWGRTQIGASALYTVVILVTLFSIFGELRGVGSTIAKDSERTRNIDESVSLLMRATLIQPKNSGLIENAPVVDRMNVGRPQAYVSGALSRMPSEMHDHPFYMAMMAVSEHRFDDAQSIIDGELEHQSFLAAITRAEIAANENRWDDAIEQFEAAIKLGPGEPLVYCAVARMNAQKGDYSETTRWYERGIVQAKSLGDPATTMLVHMEAADLAAWTGDRNAAKQFYDEALAGAVDHPSDDELIGDIWMGIGNLALSEANIEYAQAAFENAFNGYGLRMPYGQGTAIANLGFIEFEREEYDFADPRFAQARILFQDANAHIEVSNMEYHLALTAARSGRINDSYRYYEAASNSARRSGDWRAVALSEYRLANALLLVSTKDGVFENRPQVIEHVNTALSAFDAAERLTPWDWGHLAECHLLLGRIAELDGSLQTQARLEFERALQIANEQQFTNLELSARSKLSGLAMMANRLDDVELHNRRILEIAGPGDHELVPAAIQMANIVCMRDGDIDRALTYLDEVKASLSRIEDADWRLYATYYFLYTRASMLLDSNKSADLVLEAASELLQFGTEIESKLVTDQAHQMLSDGYKKFGNAEMAEYHFLAGGNNRVANLTDQEFLSEFLNDLYTDVPEIGPFLDGWSEVYTQSIPDQNMDSNSVR